MTAIVNPVRTRIRAIELMLVVALSLLAGAGLSGARAHGYEQGPLKIEHPWTRATAKGATVAGGFMKITNTGTSPDRLVGGTLVAAGAFEVHETRMDGDVMRMRRLEQGLVIPPGQTIELRPGSYHIMFMQLSGALILGERVKGTLVFEKAGTIAVEFKVEAVGAKGGGQHH